MNTDNHHTHTFSYWEDFVAFFATVAICSFLLIFSFTFTHATETMAGATPVPAMPWTPAALELAPEPASVLLEVDEGWVLPEIEVNSSGIETFSMISSAKDGSIPHEHIPFHSIIIRVAGLYQVDPHLIRAIIFAESGYNPRAKSKKGARGLMQLMPLTAEALGVQDVYDPEENIDGGVRYFRSLLDRFDDDVQLALAAYNAGSRHVRNYEGVPPFRATRLYIKKVLKFYKKFKAEMAAQLV